MDRAANISDWLDNYLAPTPNVKDVRQFKLELIDGKVKVSARSRCADDVQFNQWRDLSGETAKFSSVWIFYFLPCIFLGLTPHM